MNSLFLCLLFISCVLAGKEVISATEKTFQKEVIDSPVPVLVKFYAPWCGHCKSMAPAYEQVASNLKGVLPIVEVDCTAEQALCGKYGVQGYPTLKLFKNKQPVDYNGARDAKSMISFATSNIKNNIDKVTSEDTLEKFLAKKPSLPHLLLFSEKNPSTLYQALSMRYEGKLVLGQVKKGVTDVESKYNVESFPHLVTITGEQVEHFSGDLGKDALAKYAATLASGSKPDTTDEEPAKPAAEKPKSKPKEKKEVKPVQEITSENVATVCKGVLCVIAAIDSEDASQKSVLDTLYSKYSRDGKFIFGTTSCEGETKTLCDKLGLDVKPSLAIFNTKKNKVAKVAAFTADDATSALNRALSGDLTYSKVKEDL